MQSFSTFSCIRFAIQCPVCIQQQRIHPQADTDTDSYPEEPKISPFVFAFVQRVLAASPNTFRGKRVGSSIDAINARAAAGVAAQRGPHAGARLGVHAQPGALVPRR